MAEAIQNVINPFLITHFHEQMGSASSFATLKLAQRPRVAILRTQSTWRGWSLPALGLGNRTILRPEAAHPGARLTKVFPYILTFVVQGEQDQALESSATLLVRAETILRTLSTGQLNLVSDGGERVNRLLLTPNDFDRANGSSQIRTYLDTETRDKWYCAADISIQFTTTTT